MGNRAGRRGERRNPLSFPYGTVLQPLSRGTGRGDECRLVPGLRRGAAGTGRIAAKNGAAKARRRGGSSRDRTATEARGGRDHHAAIVTAGSGMPRCDFSGIDLRGRGGRRYKLEQALFVVFARVISCARLNLGLFQSFAIDRDFEAPVAGKGLRLGRVP
jgi:hypothetical protein